MKFIFTIPGNPENPEGNPVPYVRSTRGGQFKPAVRRYNLWKDYVLSIYYDKYPFVVPKVGGRPMRIPKPVNTTKLVPGKMDLVIHWASDMHGDPDNIFKGIADALFDNDKYLAGSFSFLTASDKHGKVEVFIDIGPVDN